MTQGHKYFLLEDIEFWLLHLRYSLLNFVCMDIQFPQQQLIKRQSFPPLNWFGTFVQNQLTINIRFFLKKTLNSVPSIYRSILLPVSHCLDYYSIIVNFESKKFKSYVDFALLFQNYRGYLVSFAFPCQISAKICLLGF